jgi:CNT family concentrative nucleoside transporter
MDRLVSFVGLWAMVGLAWLMSSRRSLVPWRVVAGGVLLQFGFALLILTNSYGTYAFDLIGDFFSAVIQSTDAGNRFLFDIYPRPGEEGTLPPSFVLWRSFAFGVLPTIIFFSALMSILYHWGIMQRVVELFAWIMQRTLGTSGAETLSSAANIFVGQTEAPLVIRPYVGQMTLSELNVVMVGGFATIAGGVLAIYVRMGIDAGHLITASVISAPAALLIAKVMEPETETPQTSGYVRVSAATPSANVLEAATEGATTGLHLALNVAAMLVAFVALVAMIDAGLAWCGALFGFEGDGAWKLQRGFGLLFAPIAWLMGIPAAECREAGAMLGTRMVLNELLAYDELAAAAKAGRVGERTHVMMTYALCGFANFGSIGIQIGGIGAIAPSRRSDLARLGLRAMLGGTLASLMTACVAGVLI